MTRTPEDPFDDYSYEMDRLSQHDIEAILAGREPEDAAAADLATAIAELRQGLIRDPDPEVAERHLAAMLAAARADGAQVIDLDAARTRRRGLMRIFTTKRAAALGLAAALTLGGGIAGAVTVSERVPGDVLELVPDEVAEMLASIETGPEGAGNGENGEPAPQAEHGQTVAETAQSLEGGCEKGQTVSGVASAKASEHRQDGAEKPDPCAAGEGDEGDVEGDAGSTQGSGSVPEGVPTGKPEGAPSGKPEGAPSGRPETTPTGQPTWAPTGPPEGVPTGRPEGAGRP